MTKKISTILPVLLFCFSIMAQTSGTAYDNLQFDSRILNKKVNYSVYLPPDYNSSELNYPVLYLLHGYSDDHTAWLQFGQMNHILDDCIAEKTVVPMIVIMPDAETTWYINDAQGKVRYEDMFIQELMPFMEKTYRIKAKKEFRAVAGLSMGGFGSLVYALKYPDLFAACCPLSAGVYTDEGRLNISDDASKSVYAPFEQRKDQRIGEHWQQNNPLKLVTLIPENKKNAVRFYIDCGDDDFLNEGNSMLHILMRKHNIPHEFRIRDGNHSWEYWRTALPEVFKFVSQSFRR